jgi:hypothetical protein
VLRRRRQRPDRGYDCRGRLPAPSEPAHSGGEFHIWDFAAAAEGPNPSVTKTTRTAPHHHNDDKAGPALESRVTSLGDDPARGYCEVVTSPSLSPGDSDDLLAHYCMSDLTLQTFEFGKGRVSPPSPWGPIKLTRIGLGGRHRCA